MKHAPVTGTADMLHKIEIIEQEVMKLKLSVLKKLAPAGKYIISLRGILKGIDITDRVIAAARKSLYSKTGFTTAVVT